LVLGPLAVLGGLKIAGLAVVGPLKEMTMASLNMAFSVLEHAEYHAAIGRWQTLADLWTADEILAELNSVEEINQAPFRLDAAAICHFDGLLHSAKTCRWRR